MTERRSAPVVTALQAGPVHVFPPPKYSPPGPRCFRYSNAFCLGLLAATLLWIPQLLYFVSAGFLPFKSSERPPRDLTRRLDALVKALDGVDVASGKALVKGTLSAPLAPSNVVASRSTLESSASYQSTHATNQESGETIDHSSRMKCYARGDESELCVYDNALCFDGTQVVVASASGTTEPYSPEFPNRPDIASCFDFRFYEGSAPEYTGCKYIPASFGRDWRRLLNRSVLAAAPLRKTELAEGGSWQGGYGNAFDALAELEPTFLDRHIRTDWAIPFLSRRWGPGNRGEVVIGELATAQLFGPEPGLCEGCNAPPPPPDFGSHAPGISHVTQFGETTATWLDGPLWIVGVNAQYHIHPYHMATRLMALFTAQLSNATEFGENPADGYLLPFTRRSHPIETMWRYKIPLRRSPDQAAATDAGNAAGYVEDADAPNRVQYMTGAQWDLPRMQYVAFVGPSANGLADPSKHTRFVRGMLQLTGQRDSTYLYGNVTRHLSRHNLLCASRGAIVGTHPYIFPARADAWLFRQTAYDWAGLTRKLVTSHDNHCPRKILVVTRRTNGRVFSNDDAVIAAARSTGLEVEVIADLSKLSLKDVVRKMSGVGIMIAAHGAALVNTMFLPQHSAVIEIFPYYMKKQTYAYLAGTMGHFYFPMYSWTMPNRPINATAYAWRMLDATPFEAHCVRNNVSTFDALLLHQCNSISKLLPIDVDVPRLKAVLHDAVDAIGAYSPLNLAMVARSQSRSSTASPTRSPPPTRARNKSKKRPASVSNGKGP